MHNVQKYSLNLFKKSKGKNPQNSNKINGIACLSFIDNILLTTNFI